MFEVYEIRIVNESPLLITSPESEGNLLRTLKIGLGDKLVPVIPSTSLKGPLRRWAEILAKNMAWDDPIRTAIQNHREDERFGIIHIDIDRYMFLRDFEREKAEFEVAKYCPICYLFGSKVYRGALSLSSALPISDFEYHVYTSVSIDAKTRTKKEKALFTVEAVAPKAEFRLFAVIREQPWATEETKKAASKLWDQIINLWSEVGIRIGRRKSAGFGRTTLKILKSLNKIY